MTKSIVYLLGVITGVFILSVCNNLIMPALRKRRIL